MVNKQTEPQATRGQSKVQSNRVGHKGCVSTTLFRIILELGRFELTRETTYHQYVLAVRSKSVSTQQLLPPDFPDIVSFSAVTSSLTNYTVISPVAEHGKLLWNIHLDQKVKR
jgi:hypothetical protein